MPDSPTRLLMVVNAVPRSAEKTAPPLATISGPNRWPVVDGQRQADECPEAVAHNGGVGSRPGRRHGLRYNAGHVEQGQPVAVEWLGGTESG